MRLLKVRVRVERKPPPAPRIWWKTFGAQQGFILAVLSLLPLVTGHWLVGLLFLAVAAYGINDAWRRYG